MKTTAEMFEKAYRLGRKYSESGEIACFFTKCFDVAFDYGFQGIEIDFDDVVTGYRFGEIPEGGVSYNYRDCQFEDGLSLACVDGETEVGSSMWFSDRKRVSVRGIRLPKKGSDGETLVLPIGIEQSDF